jgi:UPF0755 protein
MPGDPAPGVAEANVQTDDLDLGWDSETVPRRHRRSTRRSEARKSGRRSGRGGRSLVALLVSLVILGALVGGAWYGIDRIRGFFEVPDYPGGGSGSVQIEILEGQSLATIGETLANDDVVKSAKAFSEAAKKDPRSLKVGPGTYQLRLKMRASDALALLLDPASRVTNTLTVAEGKIAREIFVMLAQKTGIPQADFEAAAKDPVALGVPDLWFVRDDGKAVTKSVEGFLFPAKYELPKNGTAKSILAMMVKKFLTVTDQLGFVAKAQSERHIAPYEVLIGASIAQVESPLAGDMSKVTRVLYNRLYNSNGTGHRLELDSTVNYWFKAQGRDPKASQDLTRAEMHNTANPYNTYDVAGWPAGPISNPGEDSIKAALTPYSQPDGAKWLYFVTIDKAGNTGFANTFAEHEKNIQTARKNGAL